MYVRGSSFKGHLSDRGVGIIQALMAIVVLGIAVQGILLIYQNVNSTISVAKSQTGRDSLVNALGPTLSEQSLCATRLQSTTFSSSQALSTTAGVGLPLSFSLADSTVIGAASLFFSQFNLTINSIYFNNATLQGTEQTGAFLGSLIYKGQVWVGSSSAPNEKGITSPLADRQIAPAFYIWVLGGTIANCGILKTAQQSCVDDLGGQWVYPPVGSNPPCLNVPYQCSAGYYYVPGGTPTCVASAMTCASNMTIESDGAGGTICASIP